MRPSAAPGPAVERSYREAINDALREELARDSRVVLFGEDVGRAGGAFKVTEGLQAEFGEGRVRDTPIAENTLVGMALGAALTGLRPVCEIMFVDLMALTMDQVVNFGAKIRYMTGGQATVPAVVRAPGGITGASAATHSQSLEAWFYHIPGLKVVMPSTPADAKGLLKSAIRDDNLVIFLEVKSLYNTRGPVPTGEHLIPLGSAKIKRPGRDVTVIATGAMVPLALEAGCAAGGGRDRDRGHRSALAGSPRYGDDPGLGAKDQPRDHVRGGGPAGERGGGHRRHHHERGLRRPGRPGGPRRGAAGARAVLPRAGRA